MAVTDRDENTTMFVYDNHFLLEIITAINVTILLLEFDTDGRLIAMIDAQGHRTDLTHDIAGQAEVIFDNDANQQVIG